MSRSDALKVIGILAMTIDHIGIIFFPEYWWLRGIGRIAMPIFAYQLAVGMRYTSNKRLYLKHLFLFGIAAQIPYMMVFQITNLNILFSLFYAGCCLWLWQTKKGKWFVPVLAFLTYLIPIEYGIYAVLLPLVFYLGTEKLSPISTFLLGSIMTFFMSLFYFELSIQILAVFGIFFALYLPKWTFNFRISKYFFYWYYPLHLFVFLSILVFTASSGR